ncbi:hypothetical protein GCM10009616_34500 [Microlunatus lacustris]
MPDQDPFKGPSRAKVTVSWIRAITTDVTHGRPRPGTLVGMAPTGQTSVLVTDAALDALAHLTATWKLSRDATVRRLLADFVELQSSEDPDNRLTHISTVLNHPLCLPPSVEKIPRRRLTFRVDPDVAHEAAALAYKIPGRARRQSHRDYASRPLTDAVLTALAAARPFVDIGLDGLPDLLSWREADGLWRLTVAATLTQTERDTRRDGPPDLAAMLEDAEVVWHSRWRAQVALHLARHLFTGSDAIENRRWVGEQRDRFRIEFTNVSDDRVVFGGHEYTEGAPAERASSEGRAATAIWRGKRQMAHEDLAKWFAAEPVPGSPKTVEPPGWSLMQPSGWRVLRLPTAQKLRPQHRDLVASGALLQLPAGSTKALWPLTEYWRPVPGFDQAVAAARQLRLEPIEIAEAVLVSHLDEEGKQDEDGEDDGGETPIHLKAYPVVPMQTAYEAGLISSDELSEATRQAAISTSARIQAVLAHAERDGIISGDELRRLQGARLDPSAFGEAARDLHLKFWVSEPMWTWEVASLPAILALPSTPEQLRLRAREWFRHVQLALERDMHEAWKQAMWHIIRDRDEDYSF